MKQLILLLTILIVLTVSCSEQTVVVSYPQLNYEIRTIERYSGVRADSTKGVAFVKVAYPEIVSCDSTNTADLINQFTYCFVIEQFGDHLCENRIEVHADKFIAEYVDFMAYMPDYCLGWGKSITTTVVTDTLGIFSLGLSYFSYAGGAHPNSYKYFANFNTFNGDYIRLEDVLIEGYQDNLNKIAEKIFRNQKKLAHDADLDTAGYWFDDNTFSVNDNFLITPKGLLFFYNDYEIACYANGSTQLLIPYREMNILIKADGCLAVFQPAN
ncbi:MAG: DUF3298 domain-containing protein [candidate division Zixibacteria bacterium]|nr:DUF3298 domain-containing protein [candidate division Zixibacteria bacterium]